MTKRPISIKIKTGFRTIADQTSPEVKSVYSLLSVADAYLSENNSEGSSYDTSAFGSKALFLYKVPAGAADPEIAVDQCEYIGIICPEYLNLTNKVSVTTGAQIYWEDLPEADIDHDPGSDPEDAAHINGAHITVAETAETLGWFKSSVRTKFDMIPGITADRSKINEQFKQFIEAYKKTRAINTSMDTDKYADGSEHLSLGNETVRVKLQVKAVSETYSDNFSDVKYTVTAFVEGITDAHGYPIDALPKNMFLYSKVDNTDSHTERLEESTYLRVVDPQDIQDTNPTTFGSEKLVWGKDGAATEHTLQPATSGSGLPISDFSATLNVISPSMTRNISGYYKSRAYKIKTDDVSEAALSRNLIVSAVGAFITKYDAQRKALLGSGNDYFESEDLS